ncbi:hypothetical protein DAPPUDRAFT_312222 [Daphnia pulex]|uniref:Metallothionein n=1 Tax=Daphnia pulex TaxID=6669 RepID=E9G053_DAPPU|nr:hypothetical protein DAPPUDRAFT_312222 [Daphnia pulex]|eukprot:EFX86839.1 hypothetical protein DAPPUDRAFT_312222 [Daphnia pulex]
MPKVCSHCQGPCTCGDNCPKCESLTLPQDATCKCSTPGGCTCGPNNCRCGRNCFCKTSACCK